ncbi:MAG TPA: hypothetical protein VK743_15220 [Steroidobacteraceae bacterium]|jgi:hypothetical protein|nr:hypothetical protein [Steroidobacteraceae bacterium]
MSRVRVNIDRLVLNGIDPTADKALVQALKTELSRVIADPALHDARSQRTPVMRLGSMPLEPGTGGAHKLGTSLAQTIGRKLKP